MSALGLGLGLPLRQSVGVSGALALYGPNFLSDANARSFAGWSGDATLSDNAVAAPDGVDQADGLNDVSAVALSSRSIDTAMAPVLNDRVLVSGWVSPVQVAEWAYFGISDSTLAQAAFVRVNKVTGAVSTVAAGTWTAGSAVAQLINGWWRVEYVATVAGGVGTGNFFLSAFPAAGTTFPSFDAATQGTSYFWDINAKRIR